MIYVGTCGFSYKDWVGRFYPIGVKPAAMLEYYAARFPAVEIDSTYYAIPKPALFENMAKRTPDEFRFTVKAPGSVTHVPADGRPEQTDLAAFHDSMRPLREAQKLSAVLAQFPTSFRPNSGAWSRLSLLRDAWPDVQLVAEFRNRDWQRDEVLHELRELGVGWCNVDEPRFRSLVRPGAETTSGIGYVRFHGRNVGKWWKGSSAERYDYLYSVDQLVEWLPLIAGVADRSAQTYVYFNNHRNGQAAVNARQMAEMLRVELPSQSGDEAGSPQLSFLPAGEEGGH